MARKDLGVAPTLASHDVTKGYVDTAVAAKANIASPTFTGTVGGITKAMVGLASVDNTTDVAKPVSTAQAAADATKAAIAGQVFTGAVSATNLSGTNTGDQSAITGNAGSATKLLTPRAINGVDFDGTAAITIPVGAHTQLASTITDLATAPTSVMRFATKAARDAAIPSTKAGMLAWVDSLGSLMTVAVDGGAWDYLLDASRDVMRFSDPTTRDSLIDPASTIAGMLSWVDSLGSYQTVYNSGGPWVTGSPVLRFATFTDRSLAIDGASGTRRGMISYCDDVGFLQTVYTDYGAWYALVPDPIPAPVTVNVAYKSGYRTPTGGTAITFTKDGYGRVTVQGGVENSAAMGAGWVAYQQTSVGTVPVGYRPQGTVMIPGVTNLAMVGFWIGILRIFATGDVIWQASTAYGSNVPAGNMQFSAGSSSYRAYS